MNPIPATAAAQKLREQDLDSAWAMNLAKPAIIDAAQCIKDANQLFPADVLVLAHTLQVALENDVNRWNWRKFTSLIAGLEDIQSDCAGAMRREVE